jgi:hypothetical protein
MDDGTATILKAPRVSEVLAVTFDPARLDEDIVNISSFTVMANISPEELVVSKNSNRA